METTKKLYDLDAYGTEFEAKVLTCEEVKKKDTTGYAVTLDQTLFFPEEGGQSPDQGTINGISVLDVQIKKDVIIHTLAAPVEVGSTVNIAFTTCSSIPASIFFPVWFTAVLAMKMSDFI